jgi:hypothetical protein
MKKAGMPEEELDRPAIVICHSFPECWRLPTDGDEMESPGCPCPDPNSDEQVRCRPGSPLMSMRCRSKGCRQQDACAA